MQTANTPMDVRSWRGAGEERKVEQGRGEKRRGVDGGTGVTVDITPILVNQLLESCS